MSKKKIKEKNCLVGYLDIYKQKYLLKSKRAEKETYVKEKKTELEPRERERENARREEIFKFDNVNSIHKRKRVISKTKAVT